MAPNPRHRVSGPSFTPAPFGLMSVAQVVDDADPHWRNGIEWEASCSPEASATVAPCSEVIDPGNAGQVIAADVPAKVTADTPRGVPYDEGPAVTLYAVHRCATVGRTGQADLDRAGMLLTNGEARGLEHVVQTGETDAGTLALSLAGDATPVGGAAGTVTTAFGAIEDAIRAGYGGVGVIHAPASLVTAAIAEGHVIRSASGGRLETLLGTPVAVHSVWEPAVAGDAVIYGTGALVIYRGAVSSYADIDRKTNDSIVVAERSFAYGWDCLTVSALVSV